MKKKIFDVLFQCGICQHTDFFSENKLIEPPMWQVGDECSFYVCPDCGADDEYSIITYIDQERVFEEEEELKEWWENLSYYANAEEVSHLLPEGDEPPKGIVVESVTAWAVPKSRYPFRDWVTVREASELTGVPRKTILTWIERGKLFEMQIQGWIQNAGGSTLLLHRKVVERIEKMKNET